MHECTTKIIFTNMIARNKINIIKRNIEKGYYLVFFSVVPMTKLAITR